MASSGEKTEEPTAKRLADARNKGQVAKSTDFTAALVIVAIALVLLFYGSYVFEYLARLARELLSHQLRSTTPMTLSSFVQLYQDIIFHIAVVMSPFLGGVLFIGIAANLVQVRPLFTTHPLKPDIKKLNMLNGFKRMFSQRSLVELVKGILKMMVVGACALFITYLHRDHLFAMSHMSFMNAWELVFTVMLYITSAIAIILLIIGAADWWYQKYNLRKSLRMTKQEVKDEHKNTEGNPLIKKHVRSTAQAMARQRMLQAVPVADVVVTNPTHFAVAIQYDPDESPAPRVVAKGGDHMAFRIREVAKAHKIPIIENKPLARSLYAMVEVDHMIPPELFVAVAEVLAFVFTKRKGRQRKRSRAMNMGGVR